MIPATADVSLANACRGCGFSSMIKERHKDLVMNRYFIQLLLLALCVAAPAQSLKDIEKAHKDKMKELKKSLGLKKVEISQDDDGTYYMFLTSKDKRIGRADINGKVILPAVYDGIYKYKVDANTMMFTISKGYHKVGLADLSGKIIVPTEYSDFIFCPAIEEGKSWVYENQSLKTGDSVAVYHEAAPAVIYAKGNISRIYSMTGEVLRDSIMNDKCAYIPGFFFIGAEETSVSNIIMSSYVSAYCYGKSAFLTQSGKALIPQENINSVCIYAPAWYKDSFIKKYGKERNWCIYEVESDNILRKGGFMMMADGLHIPPRFNNVKYDDFYDRWYVKKTDMGEDIVYTPDLVDEETFRDKGEEYYEKQEYDNVISFYAHEGVEQPWAKFFTAMALQNKAKEHISNMNTISYIIEEKPENEFLIRNISFDIDLATKQLETSASLFDSYLQGGDTTYAKNAENYLRYTNIYLDSIPKCVASYEAAINTYKQRQAAQAAELQRQQELKRQQNAAFWGGILSAFIQGAANAVTGGGGSGSSGKAATTYSGGTTVSTSSSSGSSSRKASQIAEWEARRRDAESQLAKYKAQQIKDPNSAYLKSVIESTENRIRTCNERINSLRAQ